MSIRSRLAYSRVFTFILSGLLISGGGEPALAQDAGSPPPEDSSETASPLPAADLPSMNPQGFVFELESTYDGQFSTLPDEAPIYSMNFETVDEDQAKNIADSVGIEGDIQNQGEGTFSVDGDDGTLFITPGMMQFISSNDIADGDLPSDDEAIAYAREWLRQVNLLPSNVGDGTVQSRLESPPRLIVSIQPVQPAPLISALPNITVTLGPDGTVLESTYQWADISKGNTFQLRGTDSAWQEVESMRSYIETVLPGDTYETGSHISGVAEYTQVSLAYT